MSSVEILLIVAGMLGGLALFLTGMETLSGSIFEIIQLTVKGFTAKSDSISQTIRCYREEIMELASVIKKRYVRRMHEQGLEMDPDNQFTDISYILEQLIDYCDMVADALIRYHIEIGEKEHADTVTDETIRRNIHMLFEDKYEVLVIGTGDKA
ncbi:MAG: hypothetical protein IJJ31_00125 [Mogibacterium sp.]|nr:hypothetical protein [Mogibacterium sp.]